MSKTKKELSPKTSRSDFLEAAQIFAKEYNNAPYCMTRHPQSQETMFISSWETGGMRGGSCYGGTPQPYIVSSPESTEGIRALDEFLFEYFPDINFLMYKKIAHAFERSSVTDSSDYYGNSSDYALIKIHFADLWNLMRDMRLVEDVKKAPKASASVTQEELAAGAEDGARRAAAHKKAAKKSGANAGPKSGKSKKAVAKRAKRDTSWREP